MGNEEKEEDETEHPIILHNTLESRDSNHNLSQSETKDDTNFTSVEERNLGDGTAPVWCPQQSAQRLANEVIPSPLADRRTIV